MPTTENQFVKLIEGERKHRP
ncbi:hypothetical protein BIW11_10321 [Tropilaelaps mercedesae]|uniref:Uncharacterized protein n=1 Tax=Tropilaelaps mercedesae TaxID=418985 RepID=A0A1V9XGA9_9ACAR|nr:hypothetical protein BIW11_10321 [Tropilaelaps mercedesae]